MVDWLVIAAAGFLGGLLNAIAGGGSFVTLPALVFVGVNPVCANATGTAALLPGYIASAWRFRKDVSVPAGLGRTTLALIAVAGGCLGAAILLTSSERVFENLVPWLIVFATLVFAFGPRLIRGKARQSERGRPHQLPARHRVASVSIALFAVCIYGGYFNGGLGIILLAVLSLMGQTDMHGMNGLKSVLSALLTAVAVVVYAIGDTIAIEYLFVLGLAAVIGGYFGASVAYRISQQCLRGFIVLVGCVMAAAFFSNAI